MRQMLGAVPVVAIRTNGAIRVLADRCSHRSGPLSDGELADGCLICPWHGSVFRVADGSVARGPATAPQPAFEVREADGAIQVCLPGAGEHAPGRAAGPRPRRTRSRKISVLVSGGAPAGTRTTAGRTCR